MTPVERLILSFADDEFILGYRDSEWTGVAPFIEEDIAFSSIAQDEIGHARALYELLEAYSGRKADETAFGRQPSEYLNCTLVEHPREDWAFSIARQYLYDTADAVRVDALLRSSLRPLADICQKMAREEKYHQLHLHSWIERLANGSVESRERLERALEKAFPLALGVFEAIQGEDDLVLGGVQPRSNLELMTAFRERTSLHLQGFGLSLEPEAKPALGGRCGAHTTAFSTLWAEMTLVYRQDPEAVW